VRYRARARRGGGGAPRGRIGPCIWPLRRGRAVLPGGTLADLITTGGHREMDGTELVAPINQHQQVSKEQSCRSCYRNHAKNGLLALIAVGVILCSALLWVTRGDLVHGFANEANILSGGAADGGSSSSSSSHHANGHGAGNGLVYCTVRGDDPCIGPLPGEPSTTVTTNRMLLATSDSAPEAVPEPEPDPPAITPFRACLNALTKVCPTSHYDDPESCASCAGEEAARNLTVCTATQSGLKGLAEFCPQNTGGAPPCWGACTKSFVSTCKQGSTSTNCTDCVAAHALQQASSCHDVRTLQSIAAFCPSQNSASAQCTSSAQCPVGQGCIQNVSSRSRPIKCAACATGNDVQGDAIYVDPCSAAFKTNCPKEFAALNCCDSTSQCPIGRSCKLLNGPKSVQPKTYYDCADHDAAKCLSCDWGDGQCLDPSGDCCSATFERKCPSDPNHCKSCAKTADCPGDEYCSAEGRCKQCSAWCSSSNSSRRCDAINGDCCSQSFTAHCDCDPLHCVKCRVHSDCPQKSGMSGIFGDGGPEYCTSKGVCKQCSVQQQLIGGERCDSIDGNCCSRAFVKQCLLAGSAVRGCPSGPIAGSFEWKLNWAAAHGCTTIGSVYETSTATSIATVGSSPSPPIPDLTILQQCPRQLLYLPLRALSNLTCTLLLSELACIDLMLNLPMCTLLTRVTYCYPEQVRQCAADCRLWWAIIHV
jgi:hypothetical protein